MHSMGTDGRQRNPVVNCNDDLYDAAHDIIFLHGSWNTSDAA